MRTQAELKLHRAVERMKVMNMNRTSQNILPRYYLEKQKREQVFDIKLI